MRDEAGTFAGVDWRRHYEQRMATPDDIVCKVESGDRIRTVAGHDCLSLIAALIGRSHELNDIEIRQIAAWKDYGLYSPEWAKSIRTNLSFATPPTRTGVAEGFIDYTVVGFGDFDRNLDQQRPGSSRYDHCWFTATPPNDDGFCCVGAELWDLRNAMSRSRVKVAAINRFLPRTGGTTWVHVSEIDYFYEQHEPAADRIRRSPSGAAAAIAKHIEPLVRNGDTIQVGAGSSTFALASLGTFDEKEDLGYFAETSSPGLLDLVRRGVITSKYATLHPNKFVTTGLTSVGPDDWAYVNDNPFFEFYDYDYMLNPAVIAKNDNLIAINNALAVDLFGQVAVSSIGSDIRAGTGGQLAYHTGAFLSKGGRAITVLPATTSDGTKTRIVHQHPAGQIVTVPWDLADTVVTEYGVAELLGKSMRERAEALIAIAHPDVRPELRKDVSNLL